MLDNKLHKIIIFQYINCFRNPECRKLASSSKDGDVRIWDTVTGLTILSLTGHSKAVTSVKWGGNGLIYTSSQDRLIKVCFRKIILPDHTLFIIIASTVQG